MMAITPNMSEPGPLAPLTAAAWVALSPSWIGVSQLDDADGEALLAVGLAEAVAELEAAGASDGVTLGSGATVTSTVGTGAGAGATGAG